MLSQEFDRPEGHLRSWRETDMSKMTRRDLLERGSWAAAAVAVGSLGARRTWSEAMPVPSLLSEFGYGDVLVSSDLHESQLMNTHSVLMALSDDSLLKPLRQMSGMPAPGEDLGGWYDYDPGYDYRKHFDRGFAPACTFGQW